MKRPCGFSLVELLVAMAVLCMMLLFILNIVDQTSSLSSKSMARMEAARTARECFDLIGRDLSSALLPYNRSATNSLQFLASPPDLPGGYANPHSLFWQAPLSRSSQNGNLSLVGYFALRDLAANPQSNRFQLRRLYVEQSDVTNFGLLTNAGGGAWHATLAPQFAPTAESPASPLGYKGWVADGVLGLWVRCLDTAGSPIKLTAAGAPLGSSFDSRKAFQAGRHRFPATNFSALPAFVEVGLVTCSPSDLRRISTLPAPVAADDPDAFYENLNSFVAALQNENPGVKTAGAYTRIIPILTADP